MSSEQLEQPRNSRLDEMGERMRRVNEHVDRVLHRLYLIRDQLESLHHRAAELTVQIRTYKQL